MGFFESSLSSRRLRMGTCFQIVVAGTIRLHLRYPIMLLIKLTQCYITKVAFKRYSGKLDDSIPLKTFLREEMGKVAEDIAQDGCAHGVLHSQTALRLLIRLVVVLRDVHHAGLFEDA